MKPDPHGSFAEPPAAASLADAEDQAGFDLGDWHAFCQELDVAAMVPEAFARYRPAILAGLEYFFANLRPERAVAILAAQLALPAEAETSERLVAIAHHCPALHKLGQVMARDRRLPPELRRLLQRLETVPCYTDEAELKAAIERELGPLDRLGVRLDGPALAEASVAVVVPYLWQREPESAPVRGVFKVLKPDIEANLEEELSLLQGVGGLLDERCQALGLPNIAYEETFAQVRALLSREVYLADEQAHLAHAAKLYAGVPEVVIPELHPFCGPRITAMGRIDGRKVTDVDDLAAADRRRLADLVVEALIAMPVWSGGDGAFHADPHAGNLMLTDDGRLAILDWSLTGTLTKDEQVQMTQILLGAFSIDAPRIIAAITALAGGAIDRDALARVVDRALRRIGEGRLPGLDWLTHLMDEVALETRGRFSPGLIIFRKVLQTLDGVVADIAHDCHVDGVMIGCFLRHFGREWADRLMAPPFSRALPTHISNADLFHFAASAPLGAVRLWLDWQRRWWGEAGPKR